MESLAFISFSGLVFFSDSGFCDCVSLRRFRGAHGLAVVNRVDRYLVMNEHYSWDLVMYLCQ